MDEAKLRAWWSHRQGLDGSLRGATPAEVLERCGWSRSVGGAGPYLTLFSRARTTREQTDAAVANLEIHELPSARNCTYVLPAADFALGLKVGQPFAGGDMKTAMKLGVTEREIEALCDAVLRALEAGPLDPDALRAATGDASRNLGAEGKRKGLTTTLPIALGRLQARGEIRRVPINGRLDQQRYRYTLWRPGPLAGVNDPTPHPFASWHGSSSAGSVPRGSASSSGSPDSASRRRRRRSARWSSCRQQTAPTCSCGRRMSMRFARSSLRVIRSTRS
jgi:hypothetical protein